MRRVPHLGLRFGLRRLVVELVHHQLLLVLLSRWSSCSSCSSR